MNCEPSRAPSHFPAKRFQSQQDLPWPSLVGFSMEPRWLSRIEVCNFYVEPDGPSVVFRTHMYIHSWFISFIAFKWQGARTFDVQYPRTLKWTLKFGTWNLPQYPSPSAPRFCCRARLARDWSRRKPCIVHNTLPIERRAILIVTKYFQFSFF